MTVTPGKPDIHQRCRVAVYVKDCYRRTGRTKSGFEMHYNKQQCSRAAVNGKMCKQHAAMRDNGMNFQELDWHEYCER